MKKYLLSTIPVALVAVMPVKAHADKIFFNNVSEIRHEAPTGTDFRSDLVREYKELTLFEADQMYDWIDAENHAQKGMMAAKGQTPMPYDPGNWAIEDPAKMQELKVARSKLVAALDKGARTAAPKQAAHAQAKYDCWVEQQEEGHQPLDIAACKDEFESAMAALDLAMQPKTAQAEPLPGKKTKVVDEVARQTVYFDFDSDRIRPGEQSKIDAFVSEMKQIQPVVTLYIEGHTDTAGPDDYNMKLSEQRATSVRDELMRQGMTIGDYKELKVTPEGENDPAVALGDGVPEPRNRRVVILARGQVVKTDSVAAVPE